jgi:hypothetical protein
MKNTVIVIDACSRSLSTFTASVTCVNGNQNHLVLRKGADVGVVKALDGQMIEHPILVVGDYQAQSSAGFVAIFGAEFFRFVLWVGGTGQGKKKWDEEAQKWNRTGDSLRILYPMKGVLLPAGSKIQCLETHRNLSQETADAASCGLFLRSRGNKTLIISEGQSNYTNGVEIVPPEKRENPEFEWEHRYDLFSTKNLAEKYLGVVSLSQKFFISLIISALKKVEYSKSEIEKIVDKILGRGFNQLFWDFVEEGGPFLMEDFLQKGWKFETEFVPFQCKVKITSPEKVEEFFSFDLKGGSPYFIIDKFLSYKQEESYHDNRRAEILHFRLGYFSPNDEWDQKMKDGFENGKTFSIGKILRLEEAKRKETLLFISVFTGNKEDCFRHSNEVSKDKYPAIIALDERDEIIGYEVLEFNEDLLDFYSLRGTTPTLSSKYKSKKQKSEEILDLLKNFGKVEDKQIGNDRRSHYATFIFDDNGKKICAICGDGSDYITPSLQTLAEREDLMDWVFSEPFYFCVSNDTRKDIREILSKKIHELDLRISWESF